MGKWLVVAVVSALIPGCKFGSSAFTCKEDSQCAGGGTCVDKPNGMCALSDSTCTSGYRYDNSAGDHSGQCTGESGTGNTDGGTDGSTIDASPFCYGTGLVKVCLAAAPTQPRMFTGAGTTTIDTTDASMCATTISGATSYCVIAATDITINQRVRGLGPKPIVMIATGTITSNATGLIDVSSLRPRVAGEVETGAGADSALCNAGTAGNGVGGGAGGSFFGGGGSGGGVGAGGTAGTAITAVTELRGGCPGQNGNGGAAAAARGHGGGAVYLIAGTSITLAGGINAGGEGGAGAGKTNNGAGGGGGGSGGMIGLDAPVIAVTSALVANGGGGGEGSSNQNDGKDGTDATVPAAAAGGAGGTINGGDGGDGSAGAAGGGGQPGKNGNTGQNGGHGGGGGGAGHIRAPAGASLGTMVSPAAVNL